MALAPGHRFGQAIGNYCESAVESLLKEIGQKHGLYLDKKGPRPARKKAKKVRWVDQYESFHDLDYVLERNGSPHNIGTPVAFIEVAWRRYTKQSRNKAQEIQGAILPIAQRHHASAPFLGCVLVGEYTNNSIKQLANLNFHTLYFQLDTVIQAFRTVGVDVSYDETKTADELIAEKHRQWEGVAAEERPKVWTKLLELNAASVQKFKDALEAAILRRISRVLVIPLHGRSTDFSSVSGAIEFLVAYDESQPAATFVKYVVQIAYDNLDKIDAEFGDKGTAVNFLKAYETGNWTPAPQELADAVETEDDDDGAE